MALAHVEITEIMYDVPGSDSGREWIEITNEGTESIDVGKYVFFENNTNHKLKLITGTPILPPGGSAIIASDAERFLLDWPAFSNTLFDSAFSLSNTGESLAVKNSSTSTNPLTSYQSVGDANGTGGTLTKINDGWRAALASPGVHPGNMLPVPHQEKTKASVSPPKKKEVSAQNTEAISENKESQVAAAAFPLIQSFWLWTLGVFAVILLGVGGVFFLLLNHETSTEAEEFEIQ